MRLFIITLLSFAATAHARPLSSLEQNFTYAWSKSSAVFESCAKDDCGFSADELQLYHSIQSDLPQELQSTQFLFASRTHHPEDFPQRSGWPTRFATEDKVGTTVAVDLDSTHSLTLDALHDISMALSEHQLANLVSLQASTADSLGLKLQARAAADFSESPAQMVQQPRVRVLLWGLGAMDVRIFDDQTAVDLTPLIEAQAVCRDLNHQPKDFSLKDLTWQAAAAWDAKKKAQPLEFTGDLVFNCGETATQAHLNARVSFLPTFNGVAVARPDWQSIRGIALRFDPATPIEISLQ